MKIHQTLQLIVGFVIVSSKLNGAEQHIIADIIETKILILFNKLINEQHYVLILFLIVFY